MATQKYNKSEIMKSAHTLYKECKQYGRTFGSCLKQAWASAKNMVRLAEHTEIMQMILSISWQAPRAWMISSPV